MSIFKESFPFFVKKQFGIREALTTMGNDGIADHRFKSKKINLNTYGQGIKELTFDPGSYFTYQQRTCVIRMSSGANLTEKGAQALGVSKDPIDGKNYYSPNQLKEDRLARRYVLQGGVATVDKTATGTETKTTTTSHRGPSSVTTSHDNWGNKFSSHALNEDGSVKTQEVKINEWQYKEKRKYILGQRSGFRGASKNKFGLAWGDPTIASDARDGYGIVPMPGVVTADVRTKTAYGSLREAKIEFVCHNQRQLEALELLFMRPGVPVLLEWGNSAYVNNSGKKRTVDNFPYIPEWWHKGIGVENDKTLTKILDKIMKHKQGTGGNYDAMIGYVKNYDYTARADGGYDCTTELVSQGEVIEMLKGQEGIITNQDGVAELKDSFESGLELMLLWSKTEDEYTNADDETEGGTTDKTAIGKFLTQWTDNFLSWGALVSFRIGGYYGAAAYGVYSVFTAWNEMADEEEFRKGTGLFQFFGLNVLNENGGYKNLIGDYDDQGMTSATRLETLKTLILTQGRYVDGLLSRSTYIRWDALAVFMNLFVIDLDGNQKPMISINTNQIINENEPGEKVVPLNMVQPPDLEAIEPGIMGFKPIATQLFTLPPDQLALVYDNPMGIRPSDIAGTPEWNTKMQEEAVASDRAEKGILMMSCNPLIAIMPYQTRGTHTQDTIDFSGKLWGSMLHTGFGDITPEFQKKIRKKAAILDEDEADRAIGHIYLNVERLLAKYKSMRYDNEGNKVEDFDMFTYLKKVWDDVSSATGGLHKFEFNIDHNRPHIARVVDLMFQRERELKTEEIYEMKIQSPESICRDFTYNSVIPSALSATIAISFQNPDNVKDIDSVTFAAFSRAIYDRFHVPSSEPIKPSQEEQRVKAELYDKLLADYNEAIGELIDHNESIQQGHFQEIDSETGNHASSKDGERVGKMIKLLRGLHATNTKLSTLYSYTNAGAGIYKGYVDKSRQAPSVASLVPLNFQAQLDGISGIVIGNVFKVDETRLPKMYKDANVAFIVFGESQRITAGGDWVTDITGKMTMLPSETQINTPPLGISTAMSNIIAQREGLGLSTSWNKSPLTLGLDNLDFQGQTPFADAFMQFMAGLGNKFKIKLDGGNQLKNAGDITKEMLIFAINVMGKIKQKYTYSIEVKITSGNDIYHQNIKSYTSRHTKGRAMDFTVNGDKEKYNLTGNPVPQYIKDVERILQGYSGANFDSRGSAVCRYGNEYVDPTAKSTAGHFHFSYGRGTEWQANADESKELVNTGAIQGYVIDFDVEVPTGGGLGTVSPSDFNDSLIGAQLNAANPDISQTNPDFYNALQNLPSNPNNQ